MCDRASPWLTAAEADWSRRPTPLARRKRDHGHGLRIDRTGDKVMRAFPHDGPEATLMMPMAAADRTPAMPLTAYALKRLDSRRLR